MRMGKLGLIVVIALAGCVGARGAGRHDGAEPQGATPPRAGTCAAGTSLARPLGAPHMGSSVALAEVAGRTLAFVADEDARAIETVDVDAKKVLATTPLGGAPSQLLVLGDGRVVVLLRDASRMTVLAAEGADRPLALRCSVATDAEPVALATTKDDGKLLVSAGWGQSLTVYEAASLGQLSRVALPREPRAVAVADDDQSAYVSHAVGGQISVVDLAKSEAKQVPLLGQDGLVSGFRRGKRGRAKLALPRGAPNKPGRMSCQSFALAKSMAPGGRILAPQVFVDSGEPEQRTEGYGNPDQSTEVAGVAVLDEGTRAPIDASLVVSADAPFFSGLRDARDHREECLLPRAAATDPRSRTLLVACAGIDSVIAYDASSGAPATSEKRRWVIGAGPSGIAVDPKRPRAFVWSQFDRTLGTLDLAEADLTDEKGKAPHRTAHLAMPELAAPLPAAYVLGRNLFHAVGDTRVSKDGRACASCHPDGRDDAITWSTPDGPRRSIMLAGRVAKSSPFSWTGGEKTLEDHLANTFDRLGGRGLKSQELEAVVTYITTMPGPDRARAKTAPPDTNVQRGAAIFASKEAGCSKCHATGTYADGALHDVQSRTEADRTEQFDTPSLRFVGGTGPYFHDGRYKTLHDLLRDVDGKMGHTKQLSENDLDALESYLRTL